MKRHILKIILLFALAAPVAADTLLVFGDSLSAGYGLAAGEGWVDRLEVRLRERGLDHRVINASLSGETSAGGRARLGALLERHRPDWLLLELGANDGLRGLPLAALGDNLAAMIAQARAQGSRVLLIGMQIPPNYGAPYSRRFAETFSRLAAQNNLPFVPFLMEKVALDPALMQADQLHPNAAAQPLLLDTVWAVLAPLLDGGATAPN